MSFIENIRKKIVANSFTGELNTAMEIGGSVVVRVGEHTPASLTGEEINNFSGLLDGLTVASRIGDRVTLTILDPEKRESSMISYYLTKGNLLLAQEAISRKKIA